MLALGFIVKVIIFSIWLIIIRGTLPRYRIDQLLLSIWKDWVFVWLLLVVGDTTLLLLYCF